MNRKRLKDSPPEGPSQAIPGQARERVDAVVIPHRSDLPSHRAAARGAVRMARWLAQGEAVAIPLVRPAATLFVNEEARSFGFPVNERASVLLQAHRDRSGAHASVFGPAVILGPRLGNRLTTVPDQFLNLATYRGEFQVQVSTYAEPEQWAGNDLLFTAWDEAYAWGLSLTERWTQAQYVRVVPAVGAKTLQRWSEIIDASTPQPTVSPVGKHRHPYGIRACYSVAELTGAITRAAEHVRAYQYRDLLLLQRAHTSRSVTGEPAFDSEQVSEQVDGPAHSCGIGGASTCESARCRGHHENWLAVRHGVSFAVPALRPLIEQGTFRELIERICCADSQQLSAGHY